MLGFSGMVNGLSGRRGVRLMLLAFVLSMLGESLASALAPGRVVTAATAAKPSPRRDRPAAPPIAPVPEVFTTFSHSKRAASGAVTTQVYATPQFRRQGASWIPIDATVKPRNDSRHPLSAEGAVRPIRFGGTASELVQLALDGGPITLSAPGLKIGEPAQTAEGITYRGVAADTDLRYTVTAAGVKEEVVLNSMRSPRQFTFHLDDPSGQLGGGHVEKDGSYRFEKRLDDAVVSLAAPVAYQALRGGARSGHPFDRRSANMIVKRAGHGVDVTTAVDATWLVGKNFPIVLDPTVTLTEGLSLAGAAENSPNSCGTLCGLSTNWDLGTYTGYDTAGYESEPFRSFYKFDTDSIPVGSSVSSATFSQYLIDCGGYVPACGQYAYSFEVHPMTSSWNESAYYGQLAAAMSPAVTDQVTVAPINCLPCGNETWNLTGLVQRWVDGSMANNGFAVKLWTEPFNFGGGYWSYRGPYSNYPQPVLQVVYTPNPNSATWGGSNSCSCDTTSSTGRPVNTGTGDFWHTFKDISIPGRGVPLSFGRTYNSLAAGDNNNRVGYGWTDSYNMNLTGDAYGNLTVHQENGATATFILYNGAYYPSAGVLASLWVAAPGVYGFRRQDNVTYDFSSSGQLLSETDRNGYTTTLSYINGLLAAVYDPSGRYLAFTYTYAVGWKISVIKDSAGRQVNLFYDSAGNLYASQDLRGYYTVYGYDGNHQMLTMTDPNGGQLTNAYDVNGRTTYQQDPQGRVTWFGYAPTYSVVIDPRGNEAAPVYSNNVQMGLYKAFNYFPNYALWTYGRDSGTNGITTVTDPNQNTTRRAYDARGNVISFTDALNRVTQYSYNGFNEVTSVKDPLNVTTTNSYDGRGNLTSTSRPLTATGQTATSTLIYGDSAHPGDLTAMTDANGRVWQYAYDSYGNRTRKVDPLGNVTTYAYDSIGRMTSMVSARGNASGANPAAYTTTMSYDTAGELLQVTDPLGHSTSYGYDGDGNRTSVTDGDGRRTGYAYDRDNELTTVTRADGSTLGTTYDGNGNVTSQVDGAGRVTSYTYDRFDHLASMTDPLGRTTNYSYDPVGNRLSMTDTSGQTTGFSRDAAYQLTYVQFTDPGTANVAFGYDADGQRTSMSDGTGNTTYSYDSLHRLTANTNGAGSRVGYGYDLKGQLTSLNYPNGQTASRSYDAAGRLSSVTDWLGHTTTFGHDEDAELSSEGYANGVQASLSHDAADRLSGISDSRGGTGLASFSYGRDSADQVTSSATTGVTEPNQNYTYTSLNQLSGVNGAGYGYDRSDNIQQLASVRSQNYDGANELLSASTASGGVSYGHDPRGNRTSLTPPLGADQFSYYYDQANRLSTAQPGLWPAVAAGYYHSLALRGDGTVWAWGDNSQGQLGTGSTQGSSSKVQVNGLSGVKAVAAGGYHSLALRQDGTVWAWGQNSNGELGDGTTINRSVPVQVTGLGGVFAIAAGGVHSLALKSDGTVWAWGDNSRNQLGNPTALGKSTVAVRSLLLTGASAIGAGDLHSLAVSGGSVYGWGDNTYGELGNGTNMNLSLVPAPVAPSKSGLLAGADPGLLPVQLPGMAGITAVAGGGGFSLALRGDGTVWGWGNNTYGQLGDGTILPKNTPVQAQMWGATTVKAGFYHSLALDGSGRPWVWGRGYEGQLGNGTTQPSRTPVALGITGVAGIAGGGLHSLASEATRYQSPQIAAPSGIWSWGKGDQGQLGTGGTASSNTPQLILSSGSYLYDGDGLRMSKTTPGGTSLYSWDESGSLPLMLQDGQTSYLYGEGGQPLEQIDASGAVRYYHQDQLGSTRMLTDGSGNVSATYSYDAYGNPVSSTGSVTNPLGFAGEYRDAETGFVYLRARYYDPVTAQFVSRDPAVAQTRSAYGYVKGNPLNSTDPSGMIDPADLSAQQVQELIDKCNGWDQQALCGRVAFCRDLLDCYDAAKEALARYQSLQGDCSIVGFVDRQEALRAARVAAYQIAADADRVDWSVFGAATAYASACWTGSGSGLGGGLAALLTRGVAAAWCGVAGAATRRFTR